MNFDYGELYKLLDKLSYESKLGKNLKNTLRRFDKIQVIDEIENYIDYLNENIIDLIKTKHKFRIKSIHSISLKYDRYYPSKSLNSCFNDILGIRAIVEDYESISKDIDNIRHVDMTQGKVNDDGYRGYHIYYQKSNYHYPIEVQLFTEKDYIFNVLSHKYVYKYKENYIGIRLRDMYENGNIKNENEFKEALEDVLSSSKEI